MLVKLASSPSRLVMCFVCRCVPVPIYIHCCNYQKTEFISDHKILCLAVDASQAVLSESLTLAKMTGQPTLRVSRSTSLQTLRHWRQSSQETCDLLGCCGTATYYTIYGRTKWRSSCSRLPNSTRCLTLKYRRSSQNTSLQSQRQLSNAAS